MKIEGNKIVKIEESDIINGTFLLPEGGNVTIIASNACSDNKALTKIPYGIVEVGDNAFGGCTSLTEIPDSVKTVGKYGFYGCSALEGMPDSIEAVESYAFLECISLKKISKRLVEVPHYAFADCISLTEIPNSVKTVGECGFSGCSALERMPDSIEFAGAGAFARCTSLKNVSKSLAEVTATTFHTCLSLTEIPDGIKRVEEYGFDGCTALERMPDSVEVVDYFAFRNCTSLKNISKSLQCLPWKSFAGCTSLKEIPDSVLEIKSEACSQCTSLETLPSNLKIAGQRAFERCSSLKKVPSGLLDIQDYAFAGCESLHTIQLDNIQHVSENAFSGSFINQVITPYGKFECIHLRACDFISNYLFLYANSLLKVPYKDLEEFFENDYIYRLLMENDLLYQEDTIPKFKLLFYKMRKTWDMHYRLFSWMSLKTAQEFDLSIWNRVKGLFSYGVSSEMSKAFAEMLEVFGVFVKDSKQQKRIDKLVQLLDATNFVLTDQQLQSLCESRSFSTSSLSVFFQKKDIISYQYIGTETIPEEFIPYLQHHMSEEQVHVIKKLTGTYGSQIQKFFHEHYDKVDVRVNVLSSEGIQSPTMKNAIFSAGNNSNFANYGFLHRIFDGCTESFNPEFYEFFIENLPIILHDEKIQSYVRDIQKKFSQIKSHYLYTSGTTKINLKQAMDYVYDNHFKFNPGNREMTTEVQNAGVVSQEAFDYYQEAFEKNQVRRRTSLIKRKNIYDIDGFQIKAELLRKDEIEAALVGEVNNTNCCQRYGGVGHNCMAHAVYSDDGGVFVTKLLEDGKEILLTQSWDWQNNNVYCHDNIESTPYLDNDKKLRATVAKVFQLDGEFIIEKSKNEVESYITARKKTIEKSLMSETEKEKELSLLREMEERQVIRVVTSGAGSDDLGLSEYFTSSIQVNQSMFFNNQKFTLVNFQPVNYNKKQLYFNVKELAYTDSKEKQYIIAGSLENLCLGKQEPLVPIYRDKRRVMLEVKENMRDFTFHKMQTIEKEAYPEEMQQHQDIGRDEFLEEEQNVYLGEDWYMIYEKKNDQTIYISDLAKINPSIEDESGEQIREMSTAINNLLGQYEVIEADLKEDTSYLLYLMNKKRGIVEQIGEDKVYSFGAEYEQQVVDSKEQEKILKNIKEIRNQKNPDHMMHHVTFKKGSRWKMEHESKSL